MVHRVEHLNEVSVNNVICYLHLRKESIIYQRIKIKQIGRS